MLSQQIRPLLYLGVPFFLLLVLYPLPGATQGQMHASTELLAKTVTLPAKDVRVVVKHLKFPVGYKTPEHTHPGPGPRYVLQGTLEVIEGGQTHTYHAGEAFWESGIPMTAENTGKEEVEVIAIELIPPSKTEPTE